MNFSGVKMLFQCWMRGEEALGLTYFRVSGSQAERSTLVFTSIN